jgi:hypothetical protein
MKIKLTLEIELDHGEMSIWGLEDPETKDWFLKDVMTAENLFLHSNEIGDEVGKVTKAEVEFLEDEIRKI